jgi:hypothetical protein
MATYWCPGSRRSSRSTGSSTACNCVLGYPTPPCRRGSRNPRQASSHDCLLAEGRIVGRARHRRQPDQLGDHPARSFSFGIS